MEKAVCRRAESRESAEQHDAGCLCRRLVQHAVRSFSQCHLSFLLKLGGLCSESGAAWYGHRARETPRPTTDGQVSRAHSLSLQAAERRTVHNILSRFSGAGWRRGSWRGRRRPLGKKGLRGRFPQSGEHHPKEDEGGSHRTRPRVCMHHASIPATRVEPGAVGRGQTNAARYAALPLTPSPPQRILSSRSTQPGR